MADVKFGVDQVNNPTPSKLNLYVRVFTVVAGIFMGWMLTNNLIPANTQNVISSILGLLLAITNGIAPLFGIDVSSNTKVPISQVTAMDTQQTNRS